MADLLPHADVATQNPHDFAPIPSGMPVVQQGRRILVELGETWASKWRRVYGFAGAIKSPGQEGIFGRQTPGILKDIS